MGSCCSICFPNIRRFDYETISNGPVTIESPVIAQLEPPISKTEFTKEVEKSVQIHQPLEIPHPIQVIPNRKNTNSHPKSGFFIDYELKEEIGIIYRLIFCV